MESLEKLGYYKVSKQIQPNRINSVGITKGKDQLVGYGKLKMIFSQVRVLTNKWEVLKPFLIFSKNMELGVFWNITALLSIMLGVMNIAYSCA
jgi:regulator of sigma E protease